MRQAARLPVTLLPPPWVNSKAAGRGLRPPHHRSEGCYWWCQSRNSSGGGGGGGAGQTIGSSGGGATAGSAAPAAATGQPMSADEVGKHAIWPAALPVFAVRTLRRPHVSLRRALTA
jgi:hypothetical protein